MKILITGTSRGIGKATAEKFLSCGHTVIGMDIEGSTIEHENYTHLLCDVAISPLPSIDGVEIIVANAGIQSQSEKDITVNLGGTVRIVEKYAFQPQIKAVVTVASASGSTGAEFPEYAASKGGVIAYTKNVAQRLAKYGATANSISPGGVVTEMNDHILHNEKLYDAVKKEALLKKWATAEEIAEWIYFVSVVNKSMTAQDVLIDNGEGANFNFIW